MSFFKKLIDKIKRLFKKDKKVEQPVPQPVVPVAPPVVPPVASPAVPVPPVVVVPTPEPVAPTPVEPKPEPKPVASPWPAGAYEFQPGVWYVPYGGSQGGPFSTPEQAFAWIEDVKARDEAKPEIGVDGRGPYGGNVTDNDAAYLVYMAGPYTQVKQNGDLVRDVLSYSHVDCNRVINRGDTVNPGRNRWEADTAALVMAVRMAFDRTTQ